MAPWVLQSESYPMITFLWGFLFHVSSWFECILNCEGHLFQPFPVKNYKIIISILCARGYYTERCKKNWDKRVYAGNGYCLPLCLYTCVMTGEPRTGGHSPSNKSRSHKSSNISPASMHGTIKSHLATCRSVKWCHEMGGTVPGSNPCTPLLLLLSILESNVLSS